MDPDTPDPLGRSLRTYNRSLLTCQHLISFSNHLQPSSTLNCIYLAPRLWEEKRVSPLIREGKSVIMIQIFKGKKLLVLFLLRENYVLVSVQARKQQAAAVKGQGDLPTSCKADLLLLHLMLIQEGEVLPGKFVPELHQSCNRSSQLSKHSIQGVLSLINLTL